jgi:hypothetical protein
MDGRYSSIVNCHRQKHWGFVIDIQFQTYVPSQTHFDFDWTTPNARWRALVPPAMAASSSSRGSRALPLPDVEVLVNGVWPKRVAPCRQNLFKISITWIFKSFVEFIWDWLFFAALSSGDNFVGCQPEVSPQESLRSLAWLIKGFWHQSHCHVIRHAIIDNSVSRSWSTTAWRSSAQRTFLQHSLKWGSSGSIWPWS